MQLLDVSANILTSYAVKTRYSEEVLFPSLEETPNAIESAEKVKKFVLGKLKEAGFKP